MKSSLEYIEKKKKLQESIIYFIESESDIAAKDNTIFKKLIQQLNDEKVRLDQQEMLSFLYIISSISKHHHRSENFFPKIENLLLEYKKEIRNFFTAEKLFSIFRSSKRILLFLIKEKILKIHPTIADTMINRYEKYDYKSYFLPEIKGFLTKNESNQTNEIDEKTFEENRKLGENDNHVCKLIRNDRIDEFIEYVNSTNYPLTMAIERSIFETNSFLNKRNPSLIEYSAFFGSVQIFKYLFLNKVGINESLLVYSIHGRNSEIIHLLEECLNTESNNRIYEKCVAESIKCYHDDLADYFLNKLNENVDQIENICFDGIKYFNYFYFPDDLKSLIPFYYLCKYNYYKIVSFIIQESEIEINFVVIHSQFTILFKRD